MLNNKKTIITIFLVFVMIFALSGCRDNQNIISPDSKKTTNNNDSNSTNSTITITVYYTDKTASYLVPEVHKVSNVKEPAKKALEILISGTKNPNLINVIPANTKVRSINIKDKVAYVDFSNDINKNIGGSTNEIFIVTSIVNTLTEFDSIDKVQILVEGKKLETLAGHVDIGSPLSRSNDIIKK